MPTQEEFGYESAGGVAISGIRWSPEDRPRAIVQILHGLGEHVRRYDRLARTLCARGFVVYAHDHRGHGASRIPGRELGDLGPDGWGHLVDDIGRTGELARREHPGLPLVVVGHSLGSFALQQYLLTRSDTVDVAVLSGTSLVDLMGLDGDPAERRRDFLAAFPDRRTDADWLTRDPAEVDAYLADPWCGFGMDPASHREMLVRAQALADPAQVAGMRPDLPVYLTVGSADPGNGGGSFVRELVRRYREAGLTEVDLVVWPGARHEVFNEVNRDEIVAHLREWLDARVGAVPSS